MWPSRIVAHLSKIQKHSACVSFLGSRFLSTLPNPGSTQGTGPKDLKRFYKNVSISQAEGGFEVNLDHRKLRTPQGKLFQVPTEALALAAAAEWEAQHPVIKRHTMHISSLCNTAIDNPTRRSRDVVIAGILEYLDTDTICYRMDDPDDLAALQMQAWDPLLDWLEKRFGVKVEATTGLGVPSIPAHTTDVLTQHLKSFNDWALVGYQQVVECLKSVILAAALIDREIQVEQAIKLSRLEQEYQISKWGNIEWAHDVELLDLQARVAAATVFLHINMADTRTLFNKSYSSRPV